MSLHLHRAARTDFLADGLGALLTDPLPDPFAQDLVLVPARGVERWLSQRLSQVLGSRPGRDDGVCAGVAFRSPGSLIAELSGISGVSGTSDAIDDDPWAPDAMTWPLLEVIDASLDEPWCQTLAKHLGEWDTDDEAELRKGRRYAVARRLAGLFACYARQRPQLLIDWLDGNDQDLDQDLDPDLAWQPRLWRRLVTWFAVDPPHVRHRNTVARLRDVAQRPAHPAVAVRPHPAAVTDIELLDALATHHDLHLWLPHPSDELWCALSGRRGPMPRTPRHQPACRETSAAGDVGPRPARAAERVARWAGDRRVSRRAPGAPDTLLGWLQSDIAANAAAAGKRRLPQATDPSRSTPATGPPGRSTCCARCCSACSRTITTLEPRDIVVMCPDIETCAPLIVADFGLGELSGAQPPGAPAAGPAGRPRAHPDQPAAGRGRRIARASPGAAPPPPRCSTSRRRPGAGPLRIHRRRSRHHHLLGARVRHPLELRFAPPQALRTRPDRAEHLALRARPHPDRRRDVRRLPGVAGNRAAAR